MKHLSQEQRYQIQASLQVGLTQKQIAADLYVHPSTISRELRRNKDPEGYTPLKAQQHYEQRRKNRERYKLNDLIRTRIAFLLKRRYSPEQIAGACKRHGYEMVSHESIYRFIWRNKEAGGNAYTHLRSKRKRKGKRGNKNNSRAGQIPDRRDISERPEVVELKDRFGDLEIDTIIGKKHKGCLLSVVDRASGYAMLRLLEKREADLVRDALLEMLMPLKDYLQTVTSDNGKEFTEHLDIAEKLSLQYFFARPYHSWERGANENYNGLVREYIPKGTCLSTVTQQQVRSIQDELNHRPRKRHEYLSPIQYIERNFHGVNLVAFEC